MSTVRVAGDNNQQAQAAAPAQPQASAAKPTAPKQPSKATPRQNPTPEQTMTQFTPLSRRNVIGLRRGVSSEVMRTLVETIDDLSKDVSFQDVKFDYIEMEAGNSLKISALVVAATSKNPNDKVVAHHTMILASTGTRTVGADGNFMGTKYERLLVPADGYDKRMREEVAQRLAAKFPGYTQVSAEASVVPESVNPSNEREVLALTSNATIAAATMLQTKLGQIDDFTLVGASQANMGVEIKSSFAHGTNLAGLPVRSDVIIEMTDILAQSQNNQNNNDELSYSDAAATSLVSQINGYIDMIYYPGGNNIGFGVQQNLYTYVPRFVITNMDSEVTNTLPALLLALQTTQALAEQDRWQGALLRQHKEGASHPMRGVNIRDLGVIGLEVPRTTNFNPLQQLEETKPARFPTASAANGDAMVGTLIQTYIHPKSLVISMDVEENGPNTWLTSIFVAAARGDVNADRELFDAAELLTLGNFSKRLQQQGLDGARFMINDNALINLGVWNSEYGLRDIRDWDYLSVFNATGEADPNIIRDFSDQLVNSEVDPMFRLAENRKILTDLVDGVTITGRAARVTVDPGVLFCLSQAVRDAGLVFDVKFGSGAPIGTARHTASFLSNIRTGLGSSGAFMTGMTRRPGSTGMGATSFGRWAQASNGNVGAGNY